MAKNPNNKNKAKSIKRDDALTGGMIFFVAGCIAEVFLWAVRRYYINGYIDEALLWHERLKVFAGAGVAVLLAGVALSVLWKKDAGKRVFGWALGALGAFFAAGSILIRMYESSAVTLLSVVVPVGMVLSILWALYDRECSVSITILCASLIVVWVCRKLIGSIALGTPVRIIAVIYLLAVAALVWLAKQGKLGMLLPANADVLPIYVAGGLSALTILVALFSATAAYYAMWCLGVVAFALAVYYTVKLL